ncbi:MAG: sigma-70 family RNA polymerase sigma factor, partial [Bacteroidota bacterium]
NIRDGKLELPLKSTLKTYLLGIGKHYFHKRYFNKYGQVTDIGLPEHMQWSLSSRPEIVDYFNDEWKARLVADLLNQLGEPCKELLTLSFLKGYSSEALAKSMNIPSEGAARRRKSYCLDKLRSLVESSDSFREYLNP